MFLNESIHVYLLYVYLCIIQYNLYMYTYDMDFIYMTQIDDSYIYGSYV